MAAVGLHGAGLPTSLAPLNPAFPTLRSFGGSRRYIPDRAISGSGGPITPHRRLSRGRPRPSSATASRLQRAGGPVDAGHRLMDFFRRAPSAPRPEPNSVPHASPDAFHRPGPPSRVSPGYPGDPAMEHRPSTSWKDHSEGPAVGAEAPHWPGPASKSRRPVGQSGGDPRRGWSSMARVSSLLCS